MSKSKLIEEGKNIDLDGGITVINEGYSLAEKAEEKAPEVTSVEQDAPVVEPVVAPVDSVATPTAPATDSALASPVTSMPEVTPIPGFVAPVTSVDPMAAINPEFTSTVDPVTSFTPVYPPYTGDSTYASQVAADEASGNQLFAPDANVIGTNDFAKSYEDVSYEKVATTIVTEEDAQKAKTAFMIATEEIYDKGPGNQIKILMEVAARQNAKLLEIAEKGFMNAKDYEEIKTLDNLYKGLKPKETPEYSDNQNNINFGGMNY